MNLKRMMHLFSIILVSFFVCACSANNSLKSDFINYYKEQLDEGAFITSMGTKFIIGSLDKENTSNHPNVVLLVFLNSNNHTFQWLQLSADKRKDDMKEMADLVIEYAKNNKWSNDYYLYVEVGEIYGGCCITYDYEKDEIWIPNCENIYIQMYEKFNTFYKKDLEETQEGLDFLVDNNLAYIKHNQVEYRNIFCYTVYIDKKGKFSSYGKEDSTKY